MPTSGIIKSIRLTHPRYIFKYQALLKKVATKVFGDKVSLLIILKIKEIILVWEADAVRAAYDTVEDQDVGLMIIDTGNDSTDILVQNIMTGEYTSGRSYLVGGQDVTSEVLRVCTVMIKDKELDRETMKKFYNQIIEKVREIKEETNDTLWKEVQKEEKIGKHFIKF